MRSIKFRGKAKDNGRYVYGSYLRHQVIQPYPVRSPKCDNEEEYVSLIVKSGSADWGLLRSIDCIEVEESSAAQATDIFDCNGEEIYENDTVHQVCMLIENDTAITGIVQMLEGAWKIVDEVNQRSVMLWSEHRENRIVEE